MLKNGLKSGCKVCCNEAIDNILQSSNGCEGGGISWESDVPYPSANINLMTVGNLFYLVDCDTEDLDGVQFLEEVKDLAAAFMYPWFGNIFWNTCPLHGEA